MNKNILLLEPNYKNKYPPLGLMKIAQYHRRRKDNVLFAKGDENKEIYHQTWDRIYITTLFSFEWKKTEKCIDTAVKLVNGKKRKIFVGGIAASLMTEEFLGEKKWEGIRFIQGILKEAPATSLQLTGRDFGKNDISSTPIDELVPDYAILNDIEYNYPVYDAYFGYASRGCIRKCAFCGVPKLEGMQKDMPPLSILVNNVAKLYGEKKDLILMDNNITAAPKFNEVIAEIRDLGFQKGAKFVRDGSLIKRRVDFNQGIDSRVLCKNPNLMKQLSTLCISPLRIAFDHLGVRKPYEASIRQAAENGITSLSNYMLYNFHDTPEDLYKRLILNIELNQELNIRIWSFPMRYQPINLKDRSFVGKNWNRYFLRSFQMILQATHGVVSGSPDFFYMAFGENIEKFKQLLLMPHEFIFSRSHYFFGEGRPILDEYMREISKLSESQIKELLFLLSGDEKQKGLRPSLYSLLLSDSAIDKSIRNIIRFYAAYKEVGYSVKENTFLHDSLIIPEDERVEDAGLYDNSLVIFDNKAGGLYKNQQPLAL